MLPLRRRRSRHLPMWNCAYFASRTPRPTFSKSQKTAMLFVSVDRVIGSEAYRYSRTMPKSPRPKRKYDYIVLVLQGGGALGAYQAGVFEAMAEAGLAPNW